MKTLAPLVMISLLATTAVAVAPTTSANVDILTDACDAEGAGASCSLQCIPGATYRAKIESTNGAFATVTFTCDDLLSICTTNASCTGEEGRHLGTSTKQGTCQVYGNASIVCQRVDVREQIRGAVGA